MVKPFGIFSDVHLNNWQAFSHVTEDKINNRLAGLLAELIRCGEEVKKAGGDTLYCAGDFFHVRGSIAPSVLNPARETVRKLKAMGLKIVMIPGNHDLEGKHSEAIGSAVNTLSEDGITICHETMTDTKSRVIMVPWYENLEELRAEFQRIKSHISDLKGFALIIHAPLNDVITGLPNRGLSSEELRNLGFDNVFCGHYHHHKDFGGVYSIGALAHHSWSDVGTKAGFLIVDNGKVKWFRSHLPEFVDITGDMDEADAELAAEGNFVRIQVNESSMKEIERIRKWMTDAGAKGVIIKAIKAAKSTRTDKTGAPVTATASNASLPQTISNFVKAEFANIADAVDIECQRILAKANV